MKQINHIINGLVIQVLGWLKLQSWVLEVAAVIGLGIAGNLLVVQATSDSQRMCIEAWAAATAAWLTFGTSCMWISKIYRDEETDLIRQGYEVQDIPAKMVHAIKEDYPWLWVVVFVAAAALLVGITALVWKGKS